MLLSVSFHLCHYLILWKRPIFSLHQLFWCKLCVSCYFPDNSVVEKGAIEMGWGWGWKVELKSVMDERERWEEKRPEGPRVFFYFCRDVEYCTIIDATEKHRKSIPMLLTRNQNHCWSTSGSYFILFEWLYHHLQGTDASVGFFKFVRSCCSSQIFSHYVPRPWRNKSPLSHRFLSGSVNITPTGTPDWELTLPDYINMFNKQDVEILSCQTGIDRNAERGGKLTF